MNTEEFIVLAKEHKKTCYHKSQCEACKIEFDNDVDNVHQCDCCGKVYDSRTSDMFYYECMCNKNDRNVWICNNCEKKQILPIIHLVDKTIEDRWIRYDFGIKFVNDGCSGIYIDTCCPMTLEEFKTHRESCFNKAHCKYCSIAIDSEKHFQCDYCGNAVKHGVNPWIYMYSCECPKNHILNICTHCHDVKHYHIIEEPTKDDEGRYIGECCPMTKAAK
tara:strand:- start:28664 stop:29320 length:657 start_codon:yes stop_codon:yes gene_type:complete